MNVLRAPYLIFRFLTRKLFGLGLLAGMLSVLHWHSGLPAILSSEASELAKDGLVWNMLAMSAVVILLWVKFDCLKCAAAVFVAWACALALVAGLITWTPYAWSLAIMGFFGLMATLLFTVARALRSAFGDLNREEAMDAMFTFGAGALLLPAAVQMQVI
jgi:hypothetical protein